VALNECIFCGNPGKLTAEHIWGDWTRAYVPRPAKKHKFVNVTVARPGEHEYDDPRVRAGDPLSSKVKVVCAACNNGWMSALQNNAKPHLIPMFQGFRSMLDAAAQTQIAAWIAMATTTAEYLTHGAGQPSISESDRAHLMKEHEPSSSWRIWIGRHRGAWPGQWARASFSILEADEIPSAVSRNDRSPTTQATTFTVGNLYVHAMSSRYPDVVQGWDWRTAPTANRCLFQIWPIVSPLAFWPLSDISEQDAQSFSTAFLRYSDELAQRVGYH